MIGKIFRFEVYDKTFVYFKITEVYDHKRCRGKVIKSDFNNIYYKINQIDDFYYNADEAEEVIEQEFNKIMVFE